MNNYFKLALTFVIFQTNLSWACSPAKLVYQGKNIEVCHDQKNDLYLSKNCKDLAQCFFEKKITLQFYPNQSPGFSLCYQLGGEAFFGQIQGQKETVPMCKKNEYFADQESLLLHYRSGN